MENQETKQNLLKEAFQCLGVTLSERQTQAFLRYYELLTEKNQVMNLTAITEYDEVVVKHFADSVALFSPLFTEKLKALGIPQNPSLIDVGTGAGFPGLPLAIVNPETKVVLLDALRKRIDFLEEVVAELELSNATAIHARAEDGVKLTDFREFFDLAVSRAVSDLSILSEYCLPYVRVGGIFAAYKSAESDEEIQKAEKAIEILGGEIAETVDFSLPVTSAPRRIVLIKKVRETPEKYPRKAGKPAKSPLK